MKQIAIIGGGISGLAAAHRLLELSKSTSSPFQITLLEASGRLGGIIHTKVRDDFLIERGPDSFISEKPEAVSLAGRLGIESRLIQTNPQYRRSFIVRKGKLLRVPEGFQLLAPARIWPFITTEIFSLSGKARMAADLLLPRRSIKDESLASFVRRRLGREALERMAQPMVGGIYTADPETLSLRATLPRFLEMEREHRSIILAMLRNAGGSQTERTGVSGARYSLFLSFDCGVQVLVDALQKKLANWQVANCPPVAIHLNTTVEKLRQRGADWVIKTKDGQSIKADAVCLSVPAFVAAKFFDESKPHIATKLSGLRYASTATVNLAYRRQDIAHQLDGFGFVVPFVENRSLIACTFSSVKFAGRAPENHVLLRAFIGGALQPEMFALDEEQMLARLRTDLRDLLGIEKAPLFTEVAKWANSMPQYEVGHLERVESIEEEFQKLPGITLAGNSYRGAGIPDCIRSGERAAEKLIAMLQ